MYGFSKKKVSFAVENSTAKISFEFESEFGAYMMLLMCYAFGHMWNLQSEK